MVSFRIVLIKKPSQVLLSEEVRQNENPEDVRVYRFGAFDG